MELAATFGVDRLVDICKRQLGNEHTQNKNAIRLADDLIQVLDKPLFSDVTFVLQGGIRICAHKYVQCNTAIIWARLTRLCD